MMERMSEYHHKLLILRQIMSNKSGRYGLVNNAANIATVVVSSGLTFIGFSGTDKLHTYVNWLTLVDKTKVEFIFNLLVLLLFILLMLHLVFRFGEKQAEAFRAVVSLTHLINEIEDRFARMHMHVLDAASVELVRQKYDTLIETIPANTDKEFLAAKKDFQSKKARKLGLDLSVQSLFDSKAHERITDALIRRSELLMTALQAASQVDERLFIGGGLVRNVVWDFLHGYKKPTPIDDVDVVYYDGLSSTKEHDLAIEGKLRAIVPNLKWSVKNQARMHVVNNDAAYSSLVEAIGKWPETATAIVVRLSREDRIEFIAPHGYSDLFRLIVAPTDHFKNRLERYRERVGKKEWLKTWPRLKIVDV
jgi:hypothetical protein